LAHPPRRERFLAQKIANCYKRRPTLGMNSFFRELKNRRVYRVAIGYAIAAWLAIQISATVLPAFHASEFVLPILIVLLAVGFPVALVLAWAFDVTPSGIERTPETDGMVGAKNRRNGWLLAAVGVVIAALAVGSYWRWHPWKNGAANKSDCFAVCRKLDRSKSRCSREKHCGASV